MPFYCDHGVGAAPDDVTSMSATGPASVAPMMFTTTHWSVVLEAQGESPAAQEALENLCRNYWQPIYGFVRRDGAKPEEAKDITQGFFALILERKAGGLERGLNKDHRVWRVLSAPNRLLARKDL